MTRGLYDEEGSEEEEQQGDDSDSDSMMLARPLAASVLLIGTMSDSSSSSSSAQRKCSLYHIENSGSFQRSHSSVVMGSISNKSRKEIKELLKDSKSVLTRIENVLNFIVKKNSNEQCDIHSSSSSSSDLFASEDDEELMFECCILSASNGDFKCTKEPLNYDQLMKFITQELQINIS
jgi:hypothetical protein